jgi:NAD+ synthase
MLSIPSVNIKETLTIIQSFIKTYLENAHYKSVVIGFSGGIDSAVSAVICKNILGKNYVHCLFLPDDTTSEQDKRDVQILEKKFDLFIKQYDISGFVELIKNQCLSKQSNVIVGNLKARIRMLFLYAYANEHNCLVCGTANKSELLVGYFTKYGDGGADLLPLGDLYKSDVLKLADFLGIPEKMISKPPTAGLWEGQTDKKELGMEYELLDKILWCLEHKMNNSTIASKCQVPLSDVDRIIHMHKTSEHKRRFALFPKIGFRSAGLDWRIPLQEG